MLDTTIQDVGYAMRALRSTPAFAGVAILSLALGIAANTAIFGLFDSLILKALPGSLQFLVLVGKVEQLTTIPLSFTEATFHQIQDHGVVMGARVKPPTGTTGFSVGFRDMPTGLVGTLHVPLQN